MFLVFQVSAGAHAVTYGDAPHDHEGTTCVIVTVAEDDQGILPVAPEHIAEPIAMDFTWQETFTSAPIVTNQSRAPPPRGPPALIQ